jgi:type II secretory pathway component PulJ
MTLVELLMAMTVTSIIFLGITGVLMVGYHLAALWGQKITEAESVNQVTGWLDQDLHRYVPCPQQVAGELHLCLANQVGASALVTYTTSSAAGGGCPCTMFRADAVSGARFIVTRDLVAQPSFTTSCSNSSTGSQTGYVRIDSLQYEPASDAPAPAASPPPMIVYFRAPLGSCP